MDTVTDIYGSLPKRKAVRSHANPHYLHRLQNWREMEIAVHAQLYQGGSTRAINTAIDRLLADPGCSWQRSTIETGSASTITSRPIKPNKGHTTSSTMSDITTPNNIPDPEACGHGMMVAKMRAAADKAGIRSSGLYLP